MTLLTLLLSWWLSPAAAWFIFFNAVVGAIAIMSASSAQAGGGATTGATPSASRRRLCRSGSSMVLDRLRSFFVFPVGQLPIDETSAASGTYCCPLEAQAAAAAASSGSQVCAPERRNPQAVAGTAGESETAAIGAAQRPSAPVAMATAEDHAPPVPSPEEEGKAEKEQGHDETISLDEAYALAQRHRAPPLASPPPPAAAAEASGTAAPAALPTEHKKKPEPAKVVADRRTRVAKAGEALEGKAELNARAELFIRQFREDLRLQRLNSILKHTHALGSPTAAAAR